MNNKHLITNNVNGILMLLDQLSAVVETEAHLGRIYNIENSLELILDWYASSTQKYLSLLTAVNDYESEKMEAIEGEKGTENIHHYEWQIASDTTGDYIRDIECGENAREKWETYYSYNLMWEETYTKRSIDSTEKGDRLTIERIQLSIHREIRELMESLDNDLSSKKGA